MSATTTIRFPATLERRSISAPFSPQSIFALSDLLPLCDFVCVLLAAFAAYLLHAGLVSLFPTMPALPAAWLDLGNMSFMGAVLAAFVLYDQQFASKLTRPWLLVISYTARILIAMASAYATGSAIELTPHLPDVWLVLWLCCATAGTISARLIVANRLRSRNRERQGAYEQ